MPNTVPDITPLVVAAGVIKNDRGEILISLRHPELHQGGLWEFPGGKVEDCETAEQALIRELQEELAIYATVISPLITIRHRYVDRYVQLVVFTVEQFDGKANSLTGQSIRWVAANQLPDYAFPAANWPIITAARLPARYAILDDVEPALLFDRLKRLLANGIKLVQARFKQLPAMAIDDFVRIAHPLCQQHQALLLLNSAMNGSLSADGVHLTSLDLMALTARPPNSQWVAASCHNQEQLHHAQNVGVDFVVLAPVLPTPTHPSAVPLGWQNFSAWVDEINIPVYALGGMNESCLMRAKKQGAQGIAAIRAFLK